MPQASYTIPKGSWVLVTGANGYIASSVADVLLELGYNVRGTIRTEKPWLNEYFTKKHGEGRFESVILSNMEKDSAFDEVAEGVSGVIHVV
jgi:nucleoside-diphosphate-sugar epimerase